MITTYQFLNYLAGFSLGLTSLAILANLGDYARLGVPPKGWIILCVWLVSLWWILCK